MDILYAVLWKQALPDARRWREDQPTGGLSVWLRTMLALLLIALLIGAVDVAARGNGVDIAAATSQPPIGKGN